MTTEDINQQIQELENLRLQTRRWRVYTALALAVIVIVGVGAIANSMYDLTRSGRKQDEFLLQFGGQLQTNVLPLAQRFAEGTIKRLKPALETELRGLDARAPQVAGVALRELSVMGTNLPAQAGMILEQTVGKTVQQREERLRKMFPGVTEPQRAALMESLNTEMQEQLLKTGEKLFQPHLNSIDSILTNVEKIANSEPGLPKQDIDSWQVAFLFLDVFTHEFKDLGAAETPSRR